MKKFIFVFLYLSCNMGFSVLASSKKEILIAHPLVKNHELQAELKAYSNLVSYADYKEEELQNADMKQNLVAAFHEAQKAFISAQVSDLEMHWLNVVSYAYKADWQKPQRLMIQTAWMRLAQISEDLERTKEYLRYAYQYDGEYIPDENIYPPPLVSQFLLLKNRDSKIKLSTSQLKDFSFILINGVKHDLKPSEINIYGGVKRFTLVSNKYLVEVKIKDVAQFAEYSPEKVALLAGTCDQVQTNPAIFGLVKNQQMIGLFPGGCKSPLSSDIKVAQLKPNKYDYSRPDFDLKKTIQTEKPFYKKTGFWVGFAAVTGAILIANQSDKKDNSTTPTNQEGF